MLVNRLLLTMLFLAVVESLKFFHVHAVVGGRVDVVVGDADAIREECGDASMRAEPALSTDGVDEVVAGRDLGADPLHAFGILRVSAAVSQIEMLGVAYRHATAGDVGDAIAGDVGIDDIVDHRDAFVTAVLDHVADEVDGIGVAHRDHSGERVDDFVLAAVPIATAVGDEGGGALNGRLPGYR
jgi:hypothetical protein